MTRETSRAVIVGGGIGGLYAARALARHPVHVTVVDRHNYHLFQPLLYQVASAGLSPGEIAQPIRSSCGATRTCPSSWATSPPIDLAGRRVLLGTRPCRTTT